MAPTEGGKQADREESGRDDKEQLEGRSHGLLLFLGSTGRPVVRGSLPRTSFRMMAAGTSKLPPFAKMHSARRPNAAGWQPALPGKTDSPPLIAFPPSPGRARQ